MPLISLKLITLNWAWPKKLWCWWWWW